MKKLFFAFILLSYWACCPKIVTETTTTTTHDTIHDTAYVNVPYEVPAIESAPIEINLSTLCDSLYKGLLQPSTQTSTPTLHSKRRLSGTVAIDSLQVIRFTCNEAAYKDTLLAVRVEYDRINSTVETVMKKYNQPNNFWKHLALITSALLGLLLYFLIKKKG